MKTLIFVVLMSVLSLVSCSDETVPSSVSSSKTSEELSKEIKSTAGVTGLTNFKVANLNIPTSGIVDGKRFYTDGKLRSSVAYYPYALMKGTKDGKARIRFYVKPTAPTSSLVGTAYPYHHRAEFTRYPWTLNHPYKTEEWVGF